MTTYYVTVAGAGDNSGDSWANAMSFSDMQAATFVAGDIFYMAGGTYSGGTDTSISSVNGSSTAPIYIIGVNSGTTNEPPVLADYATGSNRPLVEYTSGYFGLGQYYYVLNLRITTATGLHALNAGNNLLLNNCYVLNAYNNTGAYGVYVPLVASMFNCEVVATYGTGIYSTYTLYASYIHDCAVTGARLSGLGFAEHNIFDTCGIGLDNIASSTIIKNNTFYGNTTGLDLETSTITSICLNNIFDSNVTGCRADESGNVNLSMLIDYNNWSNNTRDMSWDDGSSEDNSAKGEHDTSYSPGFVDAPNGNFSLYDNSDLLKIGYTIGAGVA